MTCLSLRVLHYCVCLRLTCTPAFVCVCVCVCVCVLGWRWGSWAQKNLSEYRLLVFSFDFKIFFWSLVSGQSLIFVPGENYSHVFFFTLAENITLPPPLFKNLSKFFYLADFIVLCCCPSAVKHRVSEWCLLSYSLSPNVGYQLILTLLRQSPAGIHFLLLKKIRANT